MIHIACDYEADLHKERWTVRINCSCDYEAENDGRMELTVPPILNSHTHNSKTNRPMVGNIPQRNTRIRRLNTHVVSKHYMKALVDNWQTLGAIKIDPLTSTVKCYL